MIYLYILLFISLTLNIIFIPKLIKKDMERDKIMKAYKEIKKSFNSLEETVTKYQKILK